jgi:DNA polymerase III alpha subunit (gram-positive type)
MTIDTEKSEFGAKMNISGESHSHIPENKIPPVHTCHRCGYRWVVGRGNPYTIIPKKCPKCQSKLWNKKLRMSTYFMVCETPMLAKPDGTFRYK